MAGRSKSSMSGARLLDTAIEYLFDISSEPGYIQHISLRIQSDLDAITAPWCTLSLHALTKELIARHVPAISVILLSVLSFCPFY
jgi:hypothetical protein